MRGLLLYISLGLLLSWRNFFLVSTIEILMFIVANFGTNQTVALHKHQYQTRLINAEI